MYFEFRENRIQKYNHININSTVLKIINYNLTSHRIDNNRSRKQILQYLVTRRRDVAYLKHDADIVPLRQ
jgi:hypothetical protein